MERRGVPAGRVAVVRGKACRRRAASVGLLGAKIEIGNQVLRLSRVQP